jgi:predicted nucleic acid-binding protein
MRGEKNMKILLDTNVVIDILLKMKQLILIGMILKMHHNIL